MRGEAVPQRMNADTLGDAGTPRCQANDPMQHLQFFVYKKKGTPINQCAGPGCRILGVADRLDLEFRWPSPARIRVQRVHRLPS